MPPKVFLSYSHDSAEHKGRVLAFCDRLRKDGIEAWIDQYETSPPEGWPRWCANQVKTADFVLVVCTKTYERRFRGAEEPGRGLGTHWEGHVVIQELYESGARNSKFIPVLFPPAVPEHIPTVLRSASRYEVRSDEGYWRLVRHITGQAETPAPPLGLPVPLPLRERRTVRFTPAPEPRYEDDRSRRLEAELKGAQRLLKERTIAGQETGDIREQILQIRREMRVGGRLQPGDGLGDGRFQLLETIGRGGFAAVWKAWDEEKQELVAVKLLHGLHAEDRSRRERFFRGARKMAELRHPGIVRVIEEHLEEGGHHAFVMEYVEGGDLRAAVLSGKLAQDRVLPLILKVGEALAFAHERGLIHRDVKPANVLLDGDLPKLTDFDLVRAFDSTGGTQTQGHLGTFLYSAPEVHTDAKGAGPAADIYSLAMTAVFAFYGSDLPPDVWRRPEVFIEKIPCPATVREVLRRGIAWEPEERPASISELCRDLVPGPVRLGETKLDKPALALEAELQGRRLGGPALMTRTAHSSFSIYRGQSRRGIGEGPGQPVTHGEQYLDASPRLSQNADLLDAIRPWMTLDSDPADHQRLDDQLEAWSYVVEQDLQFVVRLASAGVYDRRAAYFAHGRAWPVAVGTGFDPGLYLGRSEAFEIPWRDNDPRQDIPDLPPELVRPDLLESSQEPAVRLLAQLLQAAAGKRPLIIAAPVSEFVSGGPLHALVSFAHGALPADLRPGCRVRIYTRTPELFLRVPGAVLVVVPEDLAGSALGIRREATLVDAQGNPLAGEALSPMARAYAENVLERAIRIPEGLTRFGERFRDRSVKRGTLPEDRDVLAVQVTYNLAVALGGTAEERGDLLRSYLPRAAQKLGPEVDWQRLITVEEWAKFPPEPLLDLLLAADSQTLVPGARKLQQSLEKTAAQLGLKVDPRLASWWDPGDPAKLRRLLELAELQPPLVSSHAVAERTAGLPLREVAATGKTVAVLEAELQSGYLRRRAEESAELGALAADAEIQAVEQGEIRPDWVRAFLGSAGGPQVVALAEKLLLRRRFFDAEEPWQGIPELLLDRLRHVEVPQLLVQVLLQVGKECEPAANLPVYLRLTDLLAGHDAGGELAGRLWRDLPKLKNVADRDLLKICKIVDARVAHDPEMAVAALAESGRWADWRRLSPWLARRPEERGRIALAWLAAPCWVQQGREAPIEDWRQAIQDLPVDLSTADLAPLWGGLAPRRSWPWIPPFEKDQLRDLAGRASDLNALADIAQVVASDSAAPDLDEPAHSYLLRHSRFAGKAARLIAPDLAKLAEQKGLLDSVVDALRRGAPRDECWRKLAAQILDEETAAEHPLHTIARQIRAEPRDASEGWAAFAAAAGRHPMLVSSAEPAFDLAVSLSHPGELGNAALRVIFATAPKERAQIAWWEALLRALATLSREKDSPDDRRDTALALVFSVVEDLPDEEKKAFRQAFEQGADHFAHWDLPTKAGR